MAKEKGVLLNKAKFAEFIGRSPRYVTGLIEEGLPVEGGGGKGVAIKINSAKAVEWMMGHNTAKQTGQPVGPSPTASPGAVGSEDSTKEQEELWLTRAKRKQEEINAEKAQANSIEIESLKPILFGVANVYGQSLDGFGARLASELASIDDAAIIKSKLFAESRRVRALTADHLRDLAAGYRRSERRPGGGTAAQDGSGMGGSEPGITGGES